MAEASFYCVDCKHTLCIFNVESLAVSAFSYQGYFLNNLVKNSTKH